ncbi:MAG: hypothetical protein ACI9CD_000284 [Candidatus Deianiraeaceae bacterium]|jgi:hypothetical protein
MYSLGELLFNQLDIYLNIDDKDIDYYVNDQYLCWARKGRMDSINNIQLYVHAKDHNPPHFHIKAPNINASFRIYDCSLLRGKEPQKNIMKKIKIMYDRNKTELQSFWEENTKKPAVLLQECFRC